MYLVLDVNKLDVERTAAELPLEVAEATICPTVEDALDERRVILENDPKANVRYFKMVRVYPTLAHETCPNCGRDDTLLIPDGDGVEHAGCMGCGWYEGAS